MTTTVTTNLAPADITAIFTRYRDACQVARVRSVQLMAVDPASAEWPAGVAEVEELTRQSNTIWQEMYRLDVQHLYRRPQTEQEPAEVIITVQADPDVVSRETHNAAVQREVDWQHRWLDKAEAAEREIIRLRNALDLTAAARASAVVTTLHQVPRQRTAKHGDGCWQRHAGCLAQRVLNLLDGAEVGR